MKKIITGLDIGTSKTCAAIASVGYDNRPAIIGVGTEKTRGINKGFVSNLDKLIDSIQKAIKAAEEKAGVKAHSIVANISGSSVSGGINEGLIPLSRRGREITKNDIKKVIDITKNIAYSLEKDFLHASPQEFIIDDNEGVEDPLGLFGIKMKVRLYTVTALASHIRNISKAIDYAGYELVDIVPTLVTAPAGMLKEEEKNSNVAIIDIGGGIAELAIFNKGCLRFFNSVNIGAMDLTSELAGHFKVPFKKAEEIKRKYGSISGEDLNKNEKNIIEIEDKQIVIETSEVNNLLKERFEKISYILKERLNTADCPLTSVSSLVVSGGGALLNGALESFEKLFNIPVRMGSVSGITCNPLLASNPVYSAAISLAKYGLTKYTKQMPRLLKSNSFLIDTFYRFKDLLEDYF